MPTLLCRWLRTAFILTVVLFTISSAAMGVNIPAFVQERDSQANSGRTTSVTLASPVTAGNLLAVYLIWDNTSGVTLADSLGNAYLAAGSPVQWSGGKYSAQIYFAISTKGGKDKLTATFATSVRSFGIIYAHEYSGVDSISPFDATASATGSTGSLNSGGATVSKEGDLLFAGGVTASTISSAGSGYTARSFAHGNITEDSVAPSLGTYTATASNRSGAWAMQLVAFRSASSSSSTGTSGGSSGPTVPTDLSAAVLSFSQIVLSWQTSSESGYAPSQLRYIVYRNGNLATTTSAGSNSWTDSGLAASTLYSYTVAALDPNGNASARSNPVTVQTDAATTQDTQAPTVFVTAPTANQSVSGIIAVGATAADNVGVTGVQFQLDGGNLGAEVTTAPYTTSWNSSQSISGSHVLAAIARDAAGNQATSPGVVVNVSNSASLRPYVTSFPLAENPISEGGNWISGKAVGLDWQDVQTVAGLAFAAGVSTYTPYNDPTAVLAGSWSPDQSAEATVRTTNQNSSIFEEVELRLRTTIAPHSITGYEVNFRCTTDGSQYVQIVRWNGPIGNFSYVTATSGPGLRNGDLIKATIIGSTITVYINGTQILQGTDRTYSSGSPGMGFYNQGGSVANDSDFGFASFTASDNLNNNSVFLSPPVNLTAMAAASSQINLTWDTPSSDNDVVGYHIYRDSAQIGTTSAAKFSDTTVVPGVQYSYAVSVFDSAGNESSPSVPVIAQTSALTDVSPPSVPTNLQSSNVTATSVNLTWSPSSDDVAVSGYHILRNGSEVGTSGSTGYLDSGLTPSTSYDYTVEAYDSSNNVSPPSADLAVTTAGAAATPPAIVQANNGQVSAGANVSVPFASPTQAGNTIVVYVIWNNTNSVALRDSRGNAYASAGPGVVWGSGNSAQVFYATGIVGGNDTVTATFRSAVSAFGVLYVHEYTGISKANPVDNIASASGASSTLNSGYLTTTGANELLFAAGVSDNSVTSADPAYVAQDLAYGNITEDRVATAIGSYAATAKHNGKYWAIQLVAFRPAN